MTPHCRNLRGLHNVSSLLSSFATLSVILVTLNSDTALALDATAHNNTVSDIASTEECGCFEGLPQWAVIVISFGFGAATFIVFLVCYLGSKSCFGLGGAKKASRGQRGLLNSSHQGTPRGRSGDLEMEVKKDARVKDMLKEYDLNRKQLEATAKGLKEDFEKRLQALAYENAQLKKQNASLAHEIMDSGSGQRKSVSNLVYSMVNDELGGDREETAHWRGYVIDPKAAELLEDLKTNP